MNLIYTKHAINRMGERNISETDINLLLNSTFLKARSNQHEDVILIMGYVGKKSIVLILDEQTGSLITVRNMRSNEKQLFERKLKGEK